MSPTYDGNHAIVSIDPKCLLDPAASPDPTIIPVPTMMPIPLPTPTPKLFLSERPAATDEECEERLWKLYRGFLWSERTKDRSSWTWEHGYDIAKENDRKWLHQKLHNLVVEINRADRLTYLLRELQVSDISKDPLLTGRKAKPLGVVRDNDTRWLSQYYMIRRALRLRPYLEQVISKWRQIWEQENKTKKGEVRKSAKLPKICQPDNQLTESDWEALENYQTILSYYEDAVKTLEGDGIARKRKRGYVGSYGNIWDAIHGYEFILKQLERYVVMAEALPDSVQFRIGVNAAWHKLKEYYGKLDETPVYYAALALYPAYRWDWFKQNWEAVWVNKAKEAVLEAWIQDYRDLVVDTGTQHLGVKRQKRFRNSFEEHRDQSRHSSRAGLSASPMPVDDE
ncbi:Uu.00g134460.m01.CDS01 [Anthostomella pinea]|uniref:Uu.00g134460.m01.CDS01 n=1 Tax=Anthostomella pinea TaxID=933095 RepID=A0AAI8VNZ1_9PEZI|nr:Uu.00g134460.m01.CDS01 [Anthostomella pinea]